MVAQKPNYFIGYFAPGETTPIKDIPIQLQPKALKVIFIVYFNAARVKQI